MFLAALLLCLIIGLAESVSDSYKAEKYKKTGGIERKYPNTWRKK